MNIMKAKLFMGTVNSPADKDFNEWIKDKNIKIIEFKYCQQRYGDHSICILYKEK